MDKTVVKALTLLEVLSASDRPRGVTELADEVGLTKANVHRLLRTLLSQGYLVQDEAHSRYQLSMKLWELGSRTVHRLELVDIARPIVRALCASADESVQLAIPDGASAVYIDKADSSHPLRATTQIGSRVPMHCVSSGKAMLAFSASFAARLRFPLSRHTPKTIITREELERELAQVRADGYAVNRGEWRLGIWGIAAPIYNASGDLIATIGVWGPEVRFRGAAAARLGRLVVDAAAKISTGIGYRVRGTGARKVVRSAK